MSDAELGRSRDFLGYGRQPPDPRWPNGAHVAVNFVINYEEGGEYSVPDGDPASEAGLTEGTTAAVVARALEGNPEAAAAIREAGWDVACHGLQRGDIAAHWRKWHPPPGAGLARCVVSPSSTTGTFSAVTENARFQFLSLRQPSDNVFSARPKAAAIPAACPAVLIFRTVLTQIMARLARMRFAAATDA